MKDYCTQNNGDCTTCSLVNYGRDCQNNPVYTCRVCGQMIEVEPEIMAMFADRPEVCSDTCGVELRKRNQKPDDNPEHHGPVNQSEPY